ncbi:phage regulatory protein/antirepressor Ant [Enterococcus sp. AZ192]|uniref:phage regulatory protein/antirepressor Ant n=1 Tax=unclassified Enterococcus TaxID=2608891 RepID=UPI003D26D588
MKLVEIKNNQPVTTSVQVAENFEKRHDHVLRDIAGIEKDVPNFGEMFFEGIKQDSYNRDRRVIYMNRDGFSLLAMGFTGKKALKFKLQYIEQFNKMENHIKRQLPNTYKEALLQLVEQVEANEKLEERALVAEQINLELRPKATYYDLILQNDSLISITGIAKDYGWSAKKMNEFLHQLGVQFKQSKTWLLYQKYADKGYTQSKTSVVNGGKNTVMHTYWTQKGRLFIYDLLKKEGYLPIIEREKESA